MLTDTLRTFEQGRTVGITSLRLTGTLELRLEVILCRGEVRNDATLVGGP
jgi:hypothetical protein